MFIVTITLRENGYGTPLKNTSVLWRDK